MPSPYLNILVAIDHSDTAAKALGQASDLAEALNARLTIVSVVPPVPAYAYRAGIDVVRLESEADKEIETLLSDARERVPESVSVETRLRHGAPPDEILAQAEEGRHDLLVLGSRGRGRLASTLLGSVAGSVHFHHLAIPMLVVHPEPGEH